MKPAVSICIPLKVTNTFRRLNWLVCSAELKKLAAIRGDVQVIAAEWGGEHAIGHDHVTRVQGSGYFTRSRARNAAMGVAKSDMICFLDSDMIMSTDAWMTAIESAKQFDCYSPYRKLKRLGKMKTRNRINDDLSFNWDIPINNREGGRLKQLSGNLAGGIFFCRRTFIESVNGWDERFVGWGYEDIALCKHAERGGYKIGWEQHQALHLWHPVDKRGRSQTLQTLRKFYRVNENKLPIQLDKIDYHLVDACNLACKFCSHYSNYRQPLNAVTLEQAEQEWSTWAKLIQPKQIMLLGGEPTLNKQLTELTDLAASIWKNTQVKIFTNGGFWENHPNLTEVLKRIGGCVFCSLHHSDPVKKQDIRDKFKETIRAGVHVHFGEIARNWQAFYRIGEDGKPTPYESEPAEAWKVCTARYCAVLKANKLWKCPQVAYADSLKSDAFPQFAKYEACEPEENAIIDFFKRREMPEDCCSHCPSKVVIVPGGEGIE